MAQIQLLHCLKGVRVTFRTEVVSRTGGWRRWRR